ncbi:tRNA (guanosine(37)-N1)-methyltransferase TrmD [Acetobacter lambici]|uniref:tRNA (guanine-N(1)-)-methyltransferase n=1 Tax=Acetobacter lambici TaxID=1332824 RepID=A0ABT1EX43_9PROT|nr:tRNA (guanosine(37)-N1)-methyltransferase TrmD [Acetobacter lambici]MCP1241408.1 tRNA (guanosine(37)-N1)-methyltransferase TrmD [Acetobacter lambici]MCP1257532.1 tRNA (guanosine(37)-N1)-methyltransferase TrmD [Acetobacter lambici]NHO55913.1 tRNA (guanosine(37)-N1)-methyltransferase TrmD [Acetobacter lambici]
MSWKATVVTLFPDMFPGPLGQSLAGRALENGVWECRTEDLREHGLGRHRAVDDTPFGGGAGMVIRPDVADAALAATAAEANIPCVYLTPRGRPLTQADVRRYAAGPGVMLLCGRFEGVDERFLQARGVEQVSIGDYVLSGGETAALVLLDACVRLLPGVMGSELSGVEESFSDGLLEYPHYTRPAVWEGHEVPEVLLSGNHAAIAQWRQAKAEETTRERRPDLWSAWLARKNGNRAAAVGGAAQADLGV